jgi:hypothetical protein
MTAFLLAGNALAGGVVDKVTGEFSRGSCFDCIPGMDLPFVSHRLLSAHEAGPKHPQKGFLFSVSETSGNWFELENWFELDFSDTFNTCVNVYEDGKARIGGVVESGSGAQVGRVFGFYLEDNGGPAYFSDMGHTVRFTYEYHLVEIAREYLQHWCQTGLLPGDPLPGYTVWFGTTVDGNYVIHNSPKDGD